MPVLAQVVQAEGLTKQRTETKVFWSRGLLLANQVTSFPGRQRPPRLRVRLGIRFCCPKGSREARKGKDALGCGFIPSWRGPGRLLDLGSEAAVEFANHRRQVVHDFCHWPPSPTAYCPPLSSEVIGIPS